MRWLGAKLTALGYEVWADVMRLQGGSDWSRELEHALRHRAAKFLVVCTPAGLEKQGVRNEIEIASSIASQVNDNHFIIPLRLDNFQAPFRIAHLQYVDFKRSWGQGFIELAELLSQFPELRKEQNQSTEAWLEAQRVGSARLIHKDEWLVSSWIPISGYPWNINYCEPPTGFQLDRFQSRAVHEWPVVPFRGGVLTFAFPNHDGFLSKDIPAKIIEEIKTETFVTQGWQTLDISSLNARKIFADLGNQAFEAFLFKNELTLHEAGIGRRWWFANIKKAPKSMIPFEWESSNGQILKGRRQIIGESEKRGVFWHYAVSGRVRLIPIQHISLSASLVFSNNGMDPFDDPRKAHRLRRSFAKGWRNARWRDMLLAFLSWIADGRHELHIPVADKKFIHLELPPADYKSSVTVPQNGDEPIEEEDPDVDDSYFDEEQETMEVGQQ